jgi:type I restriction enzyme R subunit
VDKCQLSERDICSKFITPAVTAAGWDALLQIREEVSFTKGRIIVRGKLVSRGKGKRADYILYYKPNIPLALIEAKDNTHSVGDGMQQGLNMPRPSTFPSCFPRTATASSSMTVPARAPKKRQPSRFRRSRHQRRCGPDSAPG